MSKGVYKTTKKNGDVYYRCSITKQGKHVSLGSFLAPKEAALAYNEAERLYSDPSLNLLNFKSVCKTLPQDKAITILNHRDNKIYIKTPIYLRTGYFSYFLEGVGELKFDNDDLFYYSNHRILLHDGHLYVNDYGMQYGILARFGIKNFAVAGKDYDFANGDMLDYRYQNIIVINRYHGVTMIPYGNTYRHEAKIHINGDFLIGRFSDDNVAAIAYNKAVDAARDAGIDKNFIQNYVVDYSPKQYADAYTKISLPKKYVEYLNNQQ